VRVAFSDLLAKFSERHLVGLGFDLSIGGDASLAIGERSSRGMTSEQTCDGDDKLGGTPYAVVGLAGASVLAAWMSEILVGVAEGTGKALGMSHKFSSASCSWPSSEAPPRAPPPSPWRGLLVSLRRAEAGNPLKWALTH
jgi:hypothetical protein